MAVQRQSIVRRDERPSLCPSPGSARPRRRLEMVRIVRQAIGGLLVACVLAVPAVAAQHPNDRAGAQGVGAVAAGLSGTSAATHSLRPDGRELPDGADLP